MASMNCMVCGREIGGEDPIYCHKRDMSVVVCREHRMDCTNCDSCTLLVRDGTDRIFIRQGNKTKESGGNGGLRGDRA